jgi:hypothetical protein
MFEQTVIENILLIARAYAKATGHSMTAVGKKFYGRGDFFSNLKMMKNGISISRLDEMLEKFRSEWPEETSWPLTAPVLMTRRSATHSSK